MAKIASDLDKPDGFAVLDHDNWLEAVGEKPVEAGIELVNATCAELNDLRELHCSYLRRVPCPLPAGRTFRRIGCQHPYRYCIPGPLDGLDRIGSQAEFCCTACQLEFGMHAQLGVCVREMALYRALAEE